MEKLNLPAKENAVQQKINDIIDNKQDVLVSGTNIKTINNTSLLGSGNIDIQGGGTVTVDDELSTTSTNPVQNKVITNALNLKANTADLATVATSGSYNDLSDKPTIPAAQVNSDWNASSGVAQILNKPNLATVATSGSYNDLSNKPTIPTVNNATLTIQKNGTTVNTFTANASSNVTANITVPTATSDLTNDSGYITSSALPTKTSDLTNDSGFITSSALSGYATETYVDTGLASKQDTLVSGTNIKTINNNSILGSGNITIQSAPDIDNKSITTNTSDELQTVGVIDSNNTTNAIKTWTGTKAQYDAIVTKDSNTLYNITDDTDATLPLLELLYPVGAIYIGTMNVCPLSVLGVGTWQLVASDRVLQGAGTNSVGTTVEAGLPNITGSFGGVIKGGSFTGSFTQGNYLHDWSYNNGNAYYNVNLDASRSSSIYGNSTTVQPPAYIVNIWERIS